MNDEGGQALVPVVLAFAIAAVAIVGLRAAQDRVVAGARAERTGEAAALAAAQSVADLYAVRPSAARELVVDARVIETARIAAEQLAHENGGRRVDDLRLMCAGARIVVLLTVNGHSHHAGFNAAECSPH